MNEGSQFPFTNLGLQRNPKIFEFEALLEFLPHAAILIDPQTRRILVANSRAAELSLFTRTELTCLDIKSLIPDFESYEIKETNELDDGPAQPSEVQSLILTTIIRRNKTQSVVQIYFPSMPVKEKRRLLIFNPLDFAGRLYSQSSSSQFWENLNALSSATQEANIEDALRRALEAGQSLSGAGIVAFYQALDNSPALERNLSFGADEILPERLTAQDLIQLSRPEQWTSGKRPSSLLHRAARAAGLTYLATAPIGQPNALIGLVVLADPHAAPPDFLIENAQLLATALGSIIQKHIWMSKLKTETQLQEAQLRIHAILEEHIQEGALVLNTGLEILRMNQSAELMLGYASREVAGESVEKVLIGTETIMPALAAAQQGSSTYNLGNIRLYRRNGEAFLALVRVFPVMVEEQTEAIVVFVKDLSEQEQIRLQAQQLEHRAILGEVTAIFAHEVRNPINNISTGLQVMALSLPENDPNQESISRMLQDCDRLAELIKSVLSFSRPTEYELEILDLPLLLQRLLERLRPRITRLNVVYDLKVEPGCLPVWGNPHALEQVFNNLITNALQAMGEKGGSLVLKVQPIISAEGRTYLDVSVADTGPGIPKELQERVFHPFFTTERNGTGLGLAISKRIVTAHKGNISLNSFPGGTIFHVEIPVADNKS